MFFLCSYVANFLLNDPDEVGEQIKTTSAKFLQQGRGRGARDYSDGEVCRHGRFGEKSEMFPFSSLMNFTMIFCMTYPKGWRSVACKLSWKDELWTSWQGCSLSGVASYSSWQPSWWGTQGYSLTTYAALVMTAIIKTLTMIMRRFKCWQRKIYTDKHNDDADAKCYFNADKQTIQRNANNIIISMLINKLYKGWPQGSEILHHVTPVR